MVDKTGTLTEGRPEVVAVAPAPGFAEAEVLRLAAGLERPSQHPLAGAVVRAAEARGLALAPVEGFDAPSGRGVTDGPVRPDGPVDGFPAAAVRRPGPALTIAWPGGGWGSADSGRSRARGKSLRLRPAGRFIF